MSDANETVKVTIRLHPKLAKAIKKEIHDANEKASKETPEGHEQPKSQDVSGWIRSLIERKLGMSFEMPQGMAALPKKQRKQISAQGVATRWGAESARHLQK